ncbi:hypothetical protein [Endothiovibrio diazotrophicus]
MIRGSAGDWAQVAALQADEFFRHPSLQGYQEMKRVAGKAGVVEPVRVALLDHLAKGHDTRDEERWPLPAPLVSLGDVSLTPARAPAAEILIDIAIAERRVDDVLHWHRVWKNSNAYRSRRSPEVDGAVANAVENHYPDEAITIWKGIAASLIAETKPTSYRSARAYLERIKARLSGLKREQEWSSYLAALKREHQRKRRLMEELRGL